MLQIQQRNYEFLDSLFWALADEAINHNVTDRLNEISVPTLVVWGRLDRVLDVSCTETMAADIPDNELVIFEDVGHLPMLECPRETAEHQLALVARSTP
jgi:pimeloyl-ACP methyl ester carboxylesterase